MGKSFWDNPLSAIFGEKAEEKPPATEKPAPIMQIIDHGSIVIATRSAVITHEFWNKNLEITPEQHPSDFKVLEHNGVKYISSEPDFLIEVLEGKYPPADDDYEYKKPMNAQSNIPTPQEKPPLPYDTKNKKIAQHLDKSVSHMLSQEPNKNGDRTYEIAGQRYTMTPDVYNALRTVEARSNIPFEGLAPIIARESSMNADSINTSSKACGLFQFMTNKTATLYEVTWKYADKYGYEGADDLVERNIHKNAKGQSVFEYAPVSEAAKEELIDKYCLNAQFNADMWEAYNMNKIEAYNTFLGDRDISGLELVLMNNIGLGGAKELFKQVMADKKEFGDDTSQGMKAVDFFKAQGFGDMASNRTLIKHDNGNYKTVREAYNDIKEFAGYGELKELNADPSTQMASTHSP